MSLMSSLYVGSSGLRTGQNALNTTAHNLSNMDTEGYVRQQVQQSSRSYLTLSIDVKSIANKQTGLGVNYSRVKHVRDYFYDKMYRRESGRSMFYEVSTEVMEEVESQLGEMNGEAFQTTLTDFWTAIQELAKDPASAVTQGLLVQRAEEFLERAGAVYDGLASYQDNLNLQIKQQVDKINSYGKQLLALNDTISAIEAGGIEKANDMRDARDQILDELSRMANINYGEDINGAVWVQIEGTDFVRGPRCFDIELYTDIETGFYTPFWPMNSTYRTLADGTREYINIDGAEVFNFSREISTDLNTDIGGLKAMLLARGDHRANYTDMESGNYGGVSESVIMNIQAEFDQLVHNVATKVNEILATAAGVVTATAMIDDGSGTLKPQQISFCKADSNGYMRKDDGSPIQMFGKVSSDGYRKLTPVNDVKDAQGNVIMKGGETYWVYNSEILQGEGGKPETDTLYTLGNLRIDQELMQKPSMLGFRLEDGSEDKATAEALKNAFMAEDYTLNPNVKKKASFIDYYDDLVAQIANSGYAFRCIYENQEGTVESIDGAREQVIGVSSDEELSNMIKFQNAYNASSRYINVIDEMLEHLLNSLT